MQIELKLPYPPSVNHFKKVGRTITTKSGKLLQQRVNSPETNRYFFEVWMIVQQLRVKEGLKSFGDATISLEVDVSPPDRRKRDLSNILKVLEDSLQKAQVFNDDYQISRIVVQRMSVIPGGEIIVKISKI